MKKFAFTLQTLLNVRQMEEDRIKGELAEANGELARRVTSRDVSLKEKARCEQALLGDMKNGKVNVQSLEIYDNFFAYIRDLILRQSAAIEEQEARVREIQDRLVRALQDKKALEKLKDKQYEAYLLDVKHEEDKTMDDFMSYKIVSK